MPVKLIVLKVVHLTSLGATNQLVVLEPAVLREDGFLVCRARDVTLCLRNQLTEVLIGRVQDAIFDSVLDREEPPDVVTRYANFARFLRWVEGNPIDHLAFPLCASNDTAVAPVEDDDLGVNIVVHHNADLSVVLGVLVLGCEVEVDDDFLLGGLLVPTAKFRVSAFRKSGSTCGGACRSGSAS